MIELKIGDKVIVYGGGFYASSLGLKGYITAIENNHLMIKTYFYAEEIWKEYPYWFHFKQCRKLVKMVTCKLCKGGGEIDDGDKNRDSACRYENCAWYRICPWCAGKGRINKEDADVNGKP